MNQELILVDENDHVVGFGEKMTVHRNADLHRAFSIFIINSNNELLLQKRAPGKYHSGGLWSNTCCSHPIKEEDQEITIHRRLREEMGFDCALEYVFKFIYRVSFGNDLTEHEYDHVYLGRYDGTPKPDPKEASDFKWMHLDDLRKDLHAHPECYTYWLNHAFEQFYAHHFKS